MIKWVRLQVCPSSKTEVYRSLIAIVKNHWPDKHRESHYDVWNSLLGGQLFAFIRPFVREWIPDSVIVIPKKVSTFMVYRSICPIKFFFYLFFFQQYAAAHEYETYSEP